MTLCPYLETKTYKTRRGVVTKYYCRARGLLDVISKKDAEKCHTKIFCHVREEAEAESRWGDLNPIFWGEK